jgi:ribonuclease T1
MIRNSPKALRALAAIALVLLLALAAGLAPPPGDAGTDGSRTVRLADLPPEAAATLALIRRGGPFPHERDGTVFFNREKRLPEAPHGSYREYTVPTPGLNHRGARRIVAHRAGTYYYTDDHYRSFRRIEP